MNKKIGDNAASTTKMKDFLADSEEELYSSLYEYAKNMSDAIQENHFHVENSKKLANILKNGNREGLLLTVLKVIYKMRCNLFHGRKQYDSEQRLLLYPASRCLAIINDKILQTMENKLPNLYSHEN